MTPKDNQPSDDTGYNTGIPDEFLQEFTAKYKSEEE